MADEYFRLRNEVTEMSEMGSQFTQVQLQQKRLHQIEAKIKSELDAALARSIDPEKRQAVRNTLLTIIRDAGGRLRNLEISEGHDRPWAIDSDNPRSETMPEYGEESNYLLYAHEIELRIDGSLQDVTKILQGIAAQGWYMTTKSLAMMPTDGNLPIIAAEMRLTVYGLGPKPEEAEQEFAELNQGMPSTY
ncbi:hypothetical protein Poly41_31950 [Novipirellula artificiosorum]|uniref:Uncharacterized protein n=2 Tax=Novipirellula artificiosorum TaxID=2528016 RepID=A0A5C6DQK8_9BACT|nr:hypothetical protein Poly41_31950 [Novipirellula artificiosorum]